MSQASRQKKRRYAFALRYIDEIEAYGSLPNGHFSTAGWPQLQVSKVHNLRGAMVLYLNNFSLGHLEILLSSSTEMGIRPFAGSSRTYTNVATSCRPS